MTIITLHGLEKKWLYYSLICENNEKREEKRESIGLERHDQKANSLLLFLL